MRRPRSSRWIGPSGRALQDVGVDWNREDLQAGGLCFLGDHACWWVLTNDPSVALTGSTDMFVPFMRVRTESKYATLCFNPHISQKEGCRAAKEGCRAAASASVVHCDTWVLVQSWTGSLWLRKVSFQRSQRSCFRNRALSVRIAMCSRKLTKGSGGS